MKISTSTVPLIAGFALAAIVIGTAGAASLDALQGAWAMEGTDCAEVFKKADGDIQFLEANSSLNTGVIIKGSQITGPNAVCTAGRIHQEENRLTVSLSCADAVMAGGMSVSFRLLDSEHFERFDQSFPEDSTKYYKCSL
jgi:hypothetical protein